MPKPLVSRRPNSTEAALELIAAAAMWGFGFVAVLWALQSMRPLAITGWRFFLGGVTGLTIAAVLPRLRPHLTREQFWLALPPGILLMLTILVQTWGLQYTSATKSGFITTLYVLIVPFLETLFLRRKPGRAHYVYALLALIGVALICDLPSLWSQESIADPRARWNFGDFLTLLCAIAASLHILWFGRIHARITSAFVFNGFQSMWACVIPLTLSLIFEAWPHPVFADHSAWGLLSLTFGSTLIAFALQIRGQKTLSPSVASLLFLLESPFATFFAVLILGEKLKTAQWLGAGLILLAAGLNTVLGTEPAVV